MTTYFRPAAVALVLATAAGAADAQTVITREPVATGTVIAGQPLQLTPAQRTTIYRTIIPQGRGRGPIVRERIVTEPVAPAPIVRERVVAPADTYAYGYDYNAYAYSPAPVVRERIVRQPDAYDYGYDSYAYSPPLARERIVRPPADVYQDYAFAVGTRVPASVQLAPLPRAVVTEVPAVRSYRYMVINNRLLLVDPATSIVVADLTE